nr:protein gamete expressed 1 [Quercus suber]
MGHHRHLLLLLILASCSTKCRSWGWFSSSAETQFDEKAFDTKDNSGPAKFSMEVFNDQKGARLVEGARMKLAGSNSCWQNAYRNLFAGCSDIFAGDEKRSRFAWHLGDCFQKESGRLPFPPCGPKSAMAKCLKGLNEHAHKVYLEFYLETNSICHQLQLSIISYKTLTGISLPDAQTFLPGMRSGLDLLGILSSSEIYASLSSIDNRIQLVARTTESVGDHIDVVLKHSEALYEQSEKLAASQSELQEGQVEMRKSLVDGMAMLNESYNSLGQEIDNLKNEAIEIENGINKVGDAMFLKMKNLQIKADDIWNLTGISLDKQQEVIDGQYTALEGLQNLTKFQSEALEDSRSTLQQFAEYGHRQQEELLQGQEQLQRIHDHLMENSKSILAVQVSIFF